MKGAETRLIRYILRSANALFLKYIFSKLHLLAFLTGPERKTHFACKKPSNGRFYSSMRRVYCCFLITFGFVLGCSQSNYKTTGFPGDQDRFLPASRDYDQRERVDDSMLFNKGNFDPYDDLDPDSLD
jgi:hypothetical protein